MSKVIPGRFTAQLEGSFVVFIIGMRINKWWAVRKWLPVFMAMNPMLQELYRNKDLGFLDASFHFSWRGVTLSNIGDRLKSWSSMLEKVQSI